MERTPAFLLRETNIWQLLAVTLVGAVAVRVGYTLYLSPLAAFPGPLLAKFSNLFRAYRTWKGRIDLDHYDWHQKYGSVVRIGPNTIMLGDPAMIKTVFTVKGVWQKSEMYKPNEAVFNGERVINMFNTTDEDYHARTSRPVRPLYNATRVLELEPLVDASIASLLRRLDARFAAPGRVCDFADWAAWFGWDTMFHITYGEPLGFMETEGDLVDFIKGATEGQYYFSAVSQAPWLDRFLDKNPMVRIGPRPITTAIGTTFMMLLAYKKRLAEREKMTTTETPAASGTSRVETFVDKFLALQHSHPDVVDDEQVFQYSLFNMLAGGDSTASILRAAVYHLAKNPTVRATLQAELDAAAAAAAHSEAETDGYGVPAYRDVAALPYLGAVMHELMRVTPGVSQTLERVVPPAGLVLPDGRCVPGGTRVGISPAVTCKDAGVFGPEDPLAFRPERWLRRAGEADEAFAARRRRMAATLDFVFGAGKRICMGKNLATMELYKTVAALYAAFDIQLEHPEHEWKYRAAWFVFQTDLPVLIRRRRHPNV